MTYEPKLTPEGWPYLGGGGTFRQLVDGFKWVADTHDSLVQGMIAEAVETASWAKSQTVTTSLDGWTKPGLWQIHSANLEGLPIKGIGILQVTQLAKGYVQVFYQWGTNPRMFWRAFAVDGTPYGWQEVARVSDLEALGKRIDALASSSSGGGGSAAGTKVVPLAVTAPGTTVSQVFGRGAARWSRRWAVTPTRVRVHVANRNPANATNGSALTLTSVVVGKGSAEGGLTAQSVASSGGVLPGNGTEFVTPWTEISVPDGEYVGVSVGWLGGPTDTVQMMQGGGWTTTDNVQVNASHVTGWTRSQMTPFHVWLEAEVPARTPVLLAHGDSISLGTATADPVGDSWASKYTYAQGALPVHLGQHGSALANWTSSNPRWGMYPGMNLRSVVDATVTSLGINDLAVGTTADTLKTRHTEMLKGLKGNVAGPIYYGTLTPSSKPAESEVVRREFNAWLKTLPGEARGVFDFAPVVGDASDEALRGDLSADGLHPNATGQEAMSRVLLEHPPTPFTLSPAQLRSFSGVLA